MTSRPCWLLRVLKDSAASYPLVVVGSLVLGGAAEAATNVTTTTTTPLSTSSSGDITVTSGGAINLTSGTALTLDSNNTIENDGSLSVQDSANSIGISIAPGHTGTVTSAGSIQLGAANTNTSILHPTFAANKRGILLLPGGTFTGDITNSGVLAVYGEGSYGLDIEGILTGSVVNSGSISLQGDNSAGMRIAGAVSGSITTTSMSVLGYNSSGLLVLAPVAGEITHTGTLQLTGYDTLTATDNSEDAHQSGPAIGIGANVGKGILIAGPSAADLAAVQAGTLASTSLTPQASVAVEGSANALLISPTVHAAAPTDIVIGEVGTGADAFAVINRGNLTTSGVYAGIQAEAVRIEGGLSHSTTLTGGFLNDGSITATALQANSRALVIGNGANIPTIKNTGTIAGVGSGTGNFTATGLLLEAGANASSLVNSGTLSAGYTGPTGSATVLQDESGNLTSITNTGTIVASVTPDTSTDPNATATGATVAIDLSATTKNISLTNALPANYNASVTPNAGEITGDILFGSGSNHLNLTGGIISGNVTFQGGNDLVTVSGGQLEGNLSFGAGADTLDVSGGGLVDGIITDSDGKLTLNVQNGTVGFTSTNPVSITSATFGSGGVYGIAVDAGNNKATTLNASGSVVFASGAKVSPVFFGPLGGSVNATIVSSPNLQLAGGPNSLISATVPFIYNLSLTETSSGGLDNLVVHLTPKTPQQLNISPALAPALTPVLAAVSQDQSFETGFLTASTQKAFNQAFTQMLPSYSDAFVAMERTSSLAASRQIRERLGSVLVAGRGGGLWVNEALYSMDRSSPGFDRGYDAQGDILSLGLDDLLTRKIALGLSFALDHGSYTENGDFDDPVSIRRWTGGFYTGMREGNFLFAGSVDGALTTQSTQRHLIMGSATRSTKAEWHGWKYSADTSASYFAQLGRWSFTPSVGFNYVHVYENGYTEKGGLDPVTTDSPNGNAVALQIAGRSGSAADVYSEFTIGYDINGLQTIVPFEQGQPYILRPELKFGWNYDLINSPIDTTARFVSGTQWFTIPSDPRDRQDLSAGAGFSFKTDFGTVGMDANGVFGDKTTAFVGKLNASFRF